MKGKQERLGNAHGTARLTLRINDIEYTVRPATHGVVLVKSDGTKYRVDSFGCTCPDSKYRIGLCKHRRALGLWRLV